MNTRVSAFDRRAGRAEVVLRLERRNGRVVVAEIDVFDDLAGADRYRVTGNRHAELERCLRVAEERRLIVNPSLGAGVGDAPEIVVLRVLIGLADVDQALVEHGVPVLVVPEMAGLGHVAGQEPAVAAVHHHGKGAVLGEDVMLGDGVVVVEGPGVAALGVQEVRILVDQIVNVRGVDSGVIAHIGVPEMVDDMRAVVELGNQVVSAPSAGGVVHLDHGPVRRDAVLDDGDHRVASVGLWIAPEVLAEHDGRVPVRVRRGLVPDGLVDEVGHIAGRADGRPAEVDVGLQVDVGAAVAVVAFAPDAVAVVVPPAVQSGVVQIGGDVEVLDVFGEGQFQSFLNKPVGTTIRYDVRVAAEQDPGGTPTRIRVGDEFPNLVGVVADLYTRVVGVDILGGHDAGGEALIDLLLDQRLERRRQRFAGDQHVFVRPVLGQVAARRGRRGGPVLVEGGVVVHHGRHAGPVFRRIAYGENMLRIRRPGGHRNRDLRVVDQAALGRVVSHREDPKYRNAVSAHRVRRVRHGLDAREVGREDLLVVRPEAVVGDRERQCTRRRQQVHIAADDDALAVIHRHRLDRRPLGQKDRRRPDGHDGVARRGPRPGPRQCDRRGARLAAYHRSALKAVIEHRRVGRHLRILDRPPAAPIEAAARPVVRRRQGGIDRIGLYPALGQHLPDRILAGFDARERIRARIARRSDLHRFTVVQSAVVVHVDVDGHARHALLTVVQRTVIVHVVPDPPADFARRGRVDLDLVVLDLPVAGGPDVRQPAGRIQAEPCEARARHRPRRHGQ